MHVAALQLECRLGSCQSSSVAWQLPLTRFCIILPRAQQVGGREVLKRLGFGSIVAYACGLAVVKHLASVVLQ